jgi:hypothetical protein
MVVQRFENQPDAIRRGENQNEYSPTSCAGERGHPELAGHAALAGDLAGRQGRDCAPGSLSSKMDNE